MPYAAIAALGSLASVALSSAMAYNRPGFFGHLFGGGDFSFDPQFSTAKLDYSFSEHRNLSELGAFVIRENKDLVVEFVERSK